VRENSELTLYDWKIKFGGMNVSEAKRLKQLQYENSKLKKLLADSVLDNAAFKELLSKNGNAAAKREAVAYLGDAHEMRERRARKLLGCDRMTVC
jgi:putative transposase